MSQFKQAIRRRLVCSIVFATLVGVSAKVLSVSRPIYVLTDSSGIECSVCSTQTSGRTCITNPPAPTQCQGFGACISIATMATNDGRYTVRATGVPRGGSCGV